LDISHSAFRIPHWDDFAVKASQANVGNPVPHYGVSV